MCFAIRESRGLYALSEEQIYDYVQFLRDACEIIRVDQRLKVPMRDPKDIVVLQTAVIGEADVLCTLDSDFYDPATRAFCSVAGLEVCTDQDLLKKLGR